VNGPPSTDLPYEVLMKIQQGAMAYRYRGVPLLKDPFDLALYPMLLERARPRTIIEIGSYAGGSAMWLADQAALIGLDLRVHSIDRQPPAGVAHPSVAFLQGDARDLGRTLTSSFLESIDRPLLVIEDSDHLAVTTAAVLEFFQAWLRPGEYICIEDGILTAMRAEDRYDGGPLRAIRDFLARSGGRFEVDRSLCDYFGHNVTWNVDGYLRRVS